MQAFDGNRPGRGPPCKPCKETNLALASLSRKQTWPGSPMQALQGNKPGPCKPLKETDLAEVPHGPQVLDVQVIAAVWDDHLGTLPRQRIHHVPPQEPRCSEHRRADPTHL